MTPRPGRLPVPGADRRASAGPSFSSWFSSSSSSSFSPPADSAARAAGLALGFAADRLVGDPSRFHPVAGLGRAAAAAEHRLLGPPAMPGGASSATPGSASPTPAPPWPRARGLAHTTVFVGVPAAVVAAADRATRGHPLARTACTAACVWTCLGGTSLLAVAERQRALLESGDVAGSRALLPWLCGRDPAALDAPGLSRAVVESVAENTSDAAVATLTWAALAGPAGAVAHRCANTLDAMVGHRTPRLERFGWSAARLDDVLGVPGSRLTATLTVLVAAETGGDPVGALRAWRRDAPAHPSPNAGPVEAACAGALGVRLGGTTPYPYGTQERAVLGTGRSPAPADVRAAVALERRVQDLSAMLAVAVVLAQPRRSSRLARRLARRCSASKRAP